MTHHPASRTYLQASHPILRFNDPLKGVQTNSDPSQWLLFTMASLLSPGKRRKTVGHVFDGKPYGIVQKYNTAKGTVAYTMQRERLHNTQKSLLARRRSPQLTERSKPWFAREMGLFLQPPCGALCNS